MGGLVAKTAKTSRVRFWIMMFLGEAPDLDIFLGGLGPWAFWLQHRGISHSFFGVVVQALFFAVVLGRWDKGPFMERVIHYTLPLFLHVCCDYLTSYGIPLLSPFNFKEFSGNLMPAITVIPLLFMLLGLIVIARKKIEGWHSTRWLWGAWGVTLLFALAGKTHAGKLIGASEGQVTVVSGLINPVGWMAVVQPVPCCEYHSYWVNSLTGKRKNGPQVKVSLDDFPIKASMKSPTTQRFVETIRWPTARAIPEKDGGWRVEWGKIIFSSRGMIRGLWSVHVSSTGEVGDGKRIFNFWSPLEI